MPHEGCSFLYAPALIRLFHARLSRKGRETRASFKASFTRIVNNPTALRIDRLAEFGTDDARDDESSESVIEEC
jgi:hypothetical protein